MAEVQRKWLINGVRPLAPAVIAEQAIEHDIPADWHGLVNGITIPRGRHPGVAHFLVAEQHLAGLESGLVNIECYHGDVGKKPTVTTWQNWYLESYQATTKQSEPAYWVRLRDPRWLLEKSCSEGNRYNLRKTTDSSGYVDGTTDGGTPYTWHGVIQELWSFLPVAVAGGCPSLPYSPSTTPENLVFDGIGTWRAINQVLTAIGCCVVWNPFTAVFSFVDLRVDQGLQLPAETYLLWDDRAGSTLYSMPEHAGVLFHQLPTDTEVQYNPFRLAMVYEEATIGGEQGKCEIVDPMFYYAGRNMATRATEIATSLRWLLDSRAYPYAAIYSGVFDQVPGSRLTSVRWVSDGSRGMETRLYYESEEIDWLPIPYFDKQPIKNTFSFTMLEDMGAGDGDASISSIDESELIEATVSLVNTLGQFSHLENGDKGICVKVSDSYYAIHPESDAETIELLLSKIGAIVFELDAGLARSVGATAAATVIATGVEGIDVSDSVTVVNHGGGKLGHNGSHGYAQRVGDALWVIEVNQYALLATGLLSSATHGFVSSSVIGDVLDQVDPLTAISCTAISPYPHSFLPGSTLELDNRDNHIGLSGDTALFTWDTSTETWRILKIIRQECLGFKFELTADWPSSGPASSLLAISPLWSHDTGDLPTSPDVDDTYGVAKGAKNGAVGIAIRKFHSTGASEFEALVVERQVGEIKYAFPPSEGGIPAATYNSAARKLTPGTASCRLAELVNGEYCDTGVYVVVENPVGTIVGSSGKPITVGLTSYGKWTVLVEDCSGESAPVEPTAMTPDPGESSGSRALDPGYKIGV